MKLGKKQYLITGKPVSVACAQRLQVGGLHIYLGEGCGHCVLSEENRQVLLIGYAVDPLLPNANVEQMCRTLLKSVQDPEKCFECTFGWGGRWVAFIQTEQAGLVWTDACGLRQVFFACDEEGTCAMASQARYLAECLTKARNPQAVEYINLAKKADREYAWPLNATAYCGVERLLPNHYLDVRKTAAYRIPDAFPVMDTGDPAEKAWELLSGCMDAVAGQWPVAVSVTAGLDSRLALGAAKKYHNHITAYTLRYSSMAHDHPDLVTARVLCESAGITHETIPCAGSGESFRAKYMEHGDDPHSYWVEMADGWHSYSNPGQLQVRGSCNEIGTNPAGVIPNRLVTVRLLCKFFGIPDTPFSHPILAQWLCDARKVCTQHGLSILDLFYWEHRCGSWLAQCLNEQDLAGECFTPFNIRYYLSLVCRLPVSGRIPPSYQFYKDMLDQNLETWRNIPVNPGRYDSAISKLKLLIKYHLFS